MNVKKTRVGLLTVILTIALMFSLFTVSAFAESDASSANDAPVATPADATGNSTTDNATPESTPVDSSEATKAPGTTTTPVASTTDHDHDHDHDHGDDNDNTDTIVSLIVGGVILVAIAVVCIIKREAVAKFLRGLKSEMGKIVWLPKNQTLKNTLIVLIIVAICAIAVAILDIAFGAGIRLLDGLKK